MGAKFKSKTHLLHTFFDFLSRFLRIWLQSLKKVLIWPKFFFCKNQKRCQKMQNFTLISNPLKKFWKNVPKKLQAKQVWRTWVKVKKVHFSVTFLLITFFGTFFQNFFNGFEFSVKFCVFWLLFRFFPKKIFFGHISTFSNFDCKCAGNGSKKRKIFFLWMYLRIYLCNHQRVCITKLLKSLYPSVQSSSAKWLAGDVWLFYNVREKRLKFLPVFDLLKLIRIWLSKLSKRVCIFF